MQGSLEVEEVPDELSVLVAYDVRRGSPFKKYRKFDFDLATRPISMAAVDCKVTAVEQNRLAVHPDGHGFSLEVVGFDPRRDLVVRVSATGGDE